MGKIHIHKDALARKIDKKLGPNPKVHGWFCLLVIGLSILGPIALVELHHYLRGW